VKDLKPVKYQLPRLGKGLLGKVGDVAEITVPNGMLFEILEISRNKKKNLVV
jgi:hypothetical protein